jgi:hypothetical protein
MRTLFLATLAIVGLLQPAFGEDKAYIVLDVQCPRVEDATFYHLKDKSVALLVPGMELSAENVVLCAGKETEVVVVGKDEPIENQKVIKGPAVGGIQDLYQGRVLSPDYVETAVAVQEGSVETANILRVGQEEVTLSSILLKGENKETPNEDKNFAVTNPCGYISPVQVKDLDLSTTSVDVLKDKFKKGLSLDAELDTADAHGEEE